MCVTVAVSHAADNRTVTDAGWATLTAGVHRHRRPKLKLLFGVNLANHDDTLPHYVVSNNNDWGNEAVLTYFHAQARIRRRVAAVAVLRTAWYRSNGRPAYDDTGAEALWTRAATLAHMLQLRRLCRVREEAGEGEVVEPFGRCVVSYL